MISGKARKQKSGSLSKVSPPSYPLSDKKTYFSPVRGWGFFVYAAANVGFSTPPRRFVNDKG
jgi:hypothetical protein